MNMRTELHIDTYLPHMRDVGKCEQSLQELNAMWRMIESSAKINCAAEARTILPTMAATRVGFSLLEQELVVGLVRQKCDNVMAEISTKAQYVIEIVVRNLFERTADVGFLATDGELCSFVAGQTTDAHAMRARLRAYRNKYTVYDDILLLDAAGNVMVRIDDTVPLHCSTDPLISAALGSAGYLESFGVTDLCPGKRHGLVYARRMLHPDTGSVIGVLCLCFAFEEEMARIFSTHSDQTQRSSMVLLDADNYVIASADPLWIPLGAKVPVNYDVTPTLRMFAGRQYLVRTHASVGYQGYPGPVGWQGQVMIPLDVAFSSTHSDILAGLDAHLADGLLSHANSFCPPLFDIMGAADTIRRVVWNGQVMTAGEDGELDRLKTILEQISETGARSNALFAQSIRTLFETVLASGMRDSEFKSHLLVDLLDRNLYERADDCRWWALAPELRLLLAYPDRHADQCARITSVLSYINALYTVYTCLFVYDVEGQIIASTHADGVAPESMLDQETLHNVLALPNEQAYYVSAFVPCALYEDGSTYVYHAAIRHPDDATRVVGGIGIVFDAGPEFSAMLRGALGDKQGVQAFFIDRTGTIISSTDASHPIGSTLSMTPAMLALSNGESASEIRTHDDNYVIVGATVSHGYREFKVSDGYRADVIGVVIESFGKVRQHYANGNGTLALIESDPDIDNGPEYATFVIDGDLFAIAAGDVQQALPASSIAPLSMGARCERLGILALEGNSVDSPAFVWVFDLGFFLTGEQTKRDVNSQVVVVKNHDRTIGLLASGLHDVAKFSAHRITDTPLAGNGNGMLVKQVIKANRGQLLIQVIDLDYLFTILMDPEPDTAVHDSGLCSVPDARQRARSLTPQPC